MCKRVETALVCKRVETALVCKCVENAILCTRMCKRNSSVKNANLDIVLFDLLQRTSSLSGHCRRLSIAATTATTAVADNQIWMSNSVTRCWNIKSPSFTISRLKSSHSSFLFKRDVFKVAQKVNTLYLGNFSEKICHQNFQKSPNLVTLIMSKKPAPLTSLNRVKNVLIKKSIKRFVWSFWFGASVTRKKLPNVYKSCQKWFH